LEKKNYKFDHCIRDKEHFVYQYIEYAKNLTDAPHEYHEAAALFMLSAATYGLRLKLAQHPSGLRTNIYMMLHGPTYISRKSTASDLAEEMLRKAVPGCILPNDFSPQGLQEEVAARVGIPAVIFEDEFQPVIEKMLKSQFMIGLKGFLLTMYKKSDHSYARTAKGTGKKKERDLVEIHGGHVCLLGNVTTTIGDQFGKNDMADGFLGRFAMVAPTSKPPRLAIDEQPDPATYTKELNNLIQKLSGIYQACQNIRDDDSNVRIDKRSLKILDRFQADTEALKIKDEMVYNMVQRSGDLVLKLAMIIAAGRMDPAKLRWVKISSQDAKDAVEIAKRWSQWAKTFGETIGDDMMETNIKKMESLIMRRGRLSRSEVARNYHFKKRELDEIQMTLVDRGFIGLLEIPQESGRKALWWVLRDSKAPKGVTVESSDPAPKPNPSPATNSN
jgi:hypothetical protein